MKNLSQKAIDVLLYGTGTEKLELERTTELGGGRYYTSFEGVITSYSIHYTKLYELGVQAQQYLLLNVLNQAQN